VAAWKHIAGCRTIAMLAAAWPVAGAEIARAQPAAPSQPALTASAKPNTVGDGRRAVPVSVSGGPVADEAELADYPALPVVDCDAAAVLAATHEHAPAVLAPAVRKPRTVACTARHRGAATSFNLELRPPSAGLFAEVSPPRANAGDPQVTLRPFVASGQGVRAAGALRAEPSAGSLSASAGGQLVLNLPEGKAPRAIAVAMMDGARAGAVFLPLVGRTMLPIETRPRTNVRVRIAGRWFGPVYARRRKIELPIEVPPGAWIAVTRATDRRDNAKESLADLQTPSLPRMAAVLAADQARAGESLKVVVALASPRGGPGDRKAKLVASAKLGKLTSPKSKGGGVWLLEYRAPTSPGQDLIEIRVADDPSAGSAVVDLPVVAGPPARLTVTVPQRRYGPGEVLTGSVAVSDQYGNPVAAAAVDIALGDVKAVGVPGEKGASFSLRVPTVLPEDGTLTVVASAGSVRSEAAVKSRPDAPASAKLSADADGRRARVRANIRDAHGNLSVQGDFEVLVAGATMTGIVRKKGRFRFGLIAHESARVAEIRVMAQGRELGHSRVEFAPPHRAYVLGAYATGGWLDNGGELSVPRGGVGAGLRKGFGPIEWAVLVGAEVYTFDDQVRQEIAGVEREVTRSLRALAIPVQLRGRLPLTPRIGAALGVAVLPVGADAALSSDFQQEDENRTWILGLRAQASLDVKLGPGRVVIAGTVGSARLSDGPLIGNIEGWGLLAGYEWWVLDLSR